MDYLRLAWLGEKLVPFDDDYKWCILYDNGDLGHFIKGMLSVCEDYLLGNVNLIEKNSFDKPARPMVTFVIDFTQSSPYSRMAEVYVRERMSCLRDYIDIETAFDRMKMPDTKLEMKLEENISQNEKLAIQYELLHWYTCVNSIMKEAEHGMGEKEWDILSKTYKKLNDFFSRLNMTAGDLELVIQPPFTYSFEKSIDFLHHVVSQPYPFDNDQKLVGYVIHKLQNKDVDNLYILAKKYYGGNPKRTLSELISCINDLKSKEQAYEFLEKKKSIKLRNESKRNELIQELMTKCENRGIPFDSVNYWIGEARGILYIENYVTQHWLWHTPELHPMRYLSKLIMDLKDSLSTINRISSDDIRIFSKMDKVISDKLDTQIEPKRVFSRIISTPGLP